MTEERDPAPFVCRTIEGRSIEELSEISRRLTESVVTRCAGGRRSPAKFRVFLHEATFPVAIVAMLTTIPARSGACMTIVSRLVSVAVIIGIAGIASWWSFAGAANRDAVSTDGSRQATESGPAPAAAIAPTPAATGTVATAPQPLPAAVTSAAAAAAIPADPLASAPVVPAQFAPQVASVVEAVRTGKHPERLSIAIDPAPFDATAYARDPQAYLAVVEPARVYQTAPAGPTAVPLRATVDHVIPVPALGSTELAVMAQPHAPVTFTVLDGGRMPNSLASITVQADADGRASTTYTATPGTVDEVQILVGSPMTVGTLTLRVAVAYPTAPAVSVR
jgi:hypothetical protein